MEWIDIMEAEKRNEEEGLIRTDPEYKVVKQLFQMWGADRIGTREKRINLSQEEKKTLAYQIKQLMAQQGYAEATEFNHFGFGFPFGGFRVHF